MRIDDDDQPQSKLDPDSSFFFIFWFVSNCFLSADVLVGVLWAISVYGGEVTMAMGALAAQSLTVCSLC